MLRDVAGDVLGWKGAGQPAPRTRGAVLPGDVFGIGEMTGASHRRHVNGHHLRHQHGLDGILRPDASHHRNHESEVDRVGLLPFTLALANCPPVRDSVVSPQDVPVAGNQVSAYAR
jgi:hypothetical protein